MCVQPQGTPRGTVTSMCNSDVPSQAVYARFLMVVRGRTSKHMAQPIPSAVMRFKCQFARLCESSPWASTTPAETLSMMVHQ